MSERVAVEESRSELLGALKGAIGKLLGQRKQNANAMFKSGSFGFANSCRFVLAFCSAP